MDKYVIEGGRKLSGEVRISGAKNSALPVFIATILMDDECIIKNVPKVKDVETTIELLKIFGKDVKFQDGVAHINTHSVPKTLKAPYELVKKMRASFLISGALLTRYKSAEVSLPGGCLIGVRPVDIHILGLRKLGAEVSFDSGYIKLKSKKLKGTTIELPYPSVGATENIIIAAALADGETVIKNVAIEPEVFDLCDFLNNSGAQISYLGNRTIRIKGVKKLKGVLHQIIPDRIETGTLMIASAITKGEVKLTNTNSSFLKHFISKLKKSGLEISEDEDSITTKWVRELKPVNITTAPYPKFPTDLQAQFMTLMSVVKGNSIIKETVFENRFLHVPELQRLGADLTICGNKVIVRGKDKLKGAPVMASDLRAGVALVLAGLAAEGITEVTHIYHLDRGYENLEGKLSSLGANIRRVTE